MADQGLKRQIFENFRTRDTDELIWIWQQNDRAEWSDETFEVIQDILVSRLGSVPHQNEPRYGPRKGGRIYHPGRGRGWGPFRSRVKYYWLVWLSTVLVFVLLRFIFFRAESITLPLSLFNLYLVCLTSEFLVMFSVEGVRASPYVPPEYPESLSEVWYELRTAHWKLIGRGLSFAFRRSENEALEQVGRSQRHHIYLALIAFASIPIVGRVIG